MFDTLKDRMAGLNIHWLQRRIDKVEAEHTRLGKITKTDISELEHHRFSMMMGIVGLLMSFFVAGGILGLVFFTAHNSMPVMQPLLLLLAILLIFLCIYGVMEGPLKSSMDFFFAASKIERGKREKRISTMKEDLQNRMMARMEGRTKRA
jgi:sulfite exporter TauE/SafE